MADVSLKGSRASQRRQNEIADREDLSRLEDRAQVDRFKKLRLLVPIPSTRGVVVDERLPETRRLCRPWTAAFLSRVGRDFHDRFESSLVVTSAVRSLEDQAVLRKRNGNAAPLDGPYRSSHPTGATIDISYAGMSKAEKTWMRRTLLLLERGGQIEAIEEKRQRCFHIMVSKSYLRPRDDRKRNSPGADD